MREAGLWVEETRGPLVENLHRGHVAVVDVQGRLLYGAGDPRYVTYWRSSAKPIQALAVVEEGAADRFGFTDRELALFCASHSGEAIHTGTVLEVLKKIGLTKDDLQCGVHMPLHAETAKRMVAAGEEPNALHSNCSGKHSGMLALARHKGYDVSTYTDLENPLQQLILGYVSDLTGRPRRDIVIGIDGCGVPVHGLPLYNMALAFARLARPRDMSQTRTEACRRITRAMVTHPEMVAGSQRFCSDLMRVAKGKLVGKAGAEGVYCVGVLESGMGLAFKSEVGNNKVRAAVVVEVLRQLKILDATSVEALAEYHRPVNKNHRGDVVGEFRPVIKLKKEE